MPWWYLHSVRRETIIRIIMVHVIKGKVKLENNGDGGRDLIKSKSEGWLGRIFLSKQHFL